MLYLTNGLAGLTIKDLTDKELSEIESATKHYTWEYAGCAFFTILRRDFISTIAYKKRLCGRGKKRGWITMVKEAHRWYPATDEHFTCDFLYHRQMGGGFNVLFDRRDVKRTLRWYGDDLKDPKDGLKISKWPVSGRYHVSPYDYSNNLFTQEELTQWIRDNVYKYFDLGKGARITKFAPWDFLKKYMNGLPATETFCKIGHPVMCNWDRVCKLSGTKLRAFYKWLNKVDGSIYYDEDRDSWNACKSQLWAMFTKGWTEDDYQKHLDMLLIQKKFPKSVDAKEMYTYLKKQKEGSYWTMEMKVDHYIDYLFLAKEMGFDTTDRGVRFPKDFDLRMSELRQLKQRKLDKEFDKKLKKACSSLGLPKTTEYKGGFSFVIPTTTKQFNELGNRLHICVGSCGYSKKVVDGQSLIVAAYKDGKPVNCIELELPNAKHKTYKTLQNRGAHNADSEYQEEVEKNLASYIRNANKQWRNIHGITA